MKEPDLTILDGELDRRSILKTMGATAVASSLAGCEHDEEDTGNETSGGVLPAPSLVTEGVNGALGSDADEERQQLYFVETGTNALVRYDLIPEVNSTVSSGTDTIDRTFRYDFDTGQSGSAGTPDVHWRFRTDTDRVLEPRNGARLSLLEDGTYSDLEGRELPNLEYSGDSIDGSPDSDDLDDGSVFAVETSEGNYAKVRVTSYGENLDVEYETFEYKDQRVELGTGYNTPEDVVLAGDGSTAYVTESGGSTGGALLEVTLSNADRSNATVIASDLGPVHQLALDRASGLGYVVTDSRIIRLDIDSGSRTTIASGLTGAVGIVVEAGGTEAYVSEQASGSATTTPTITPIGTPAGTGTDTASGGSGRIRRIDLSRGQKEEVVSGLTVPYHLTWADAAEDEILFVERAPENTLSKLDVVSETVSTVVADTPTDPASVSLLSVDEGLICSANAISRFDLTTSIYESAGPLFTGIGHVPVSSIDQEPDVSRSEAGYANTGPDFPFTVTDAPFGGSLDLMIDHYQARGTTAATHYRIKVDGTVHDSAWNGLEWDNTNRRYRATEKTAAGDGFFSLRQNASKWFRPRLGYVLNTRSLSNGLHDLTIEFSSSSSGSDVISGETKTVQIRIDNEGPTAQLGQIIHHLSNGGTEIVGACAIVETDTDQFEFEVTASDPQRHLRHWKLVARWGDNEDDLVDSESYADNGSGRKWTGPKNEIKPSDGPWSATERQCAHTFYLRAWTRSINGYHYIQRDGYHKSLTLMLP